MGDGRKRRALTAIAALVGFAIAFRGLVGFLIEGGSESVDVEAALFAIGNSSPWLIALISIWFGFRRLPRFRASLKDPSRPGIGAAMLMSSVILAGWAHYVAAPTLLVPALSLSVLGSAAVIGGNEALRAARLPALFLWLAIPIPAVVLNPVMYDLQTSTADAAVGILRTVGLDARSAGDMIWFRGSFFQVIESCSGVRITLTLVMAAFVLAEALDRSQLKAACLVAISPVVGIITNQLRVVSIVLNPHAEIATVHSAQGLVMIVVGVVLLAGVDWLLERLITDASPPEKSETRPASAASTRRIAAVAATAFLIAAITTFVRPWGAPESKAAEVATLPGVWDGWVEQGRPRADRQFLGSVGYDNCMLRKYLREESRVEIMICVDRRLEGGNRMLSEKMRIPGPGWNILRQGRIELSPTGQRAETRTLTSWDAQRIAISWQVGVESLATEIVRGLLSLDRGPLHRPERSVAVLLSTEIESDDPVGAKASRRLAGFVEDFSEPLSRLGAL